MTLKQFIEKLNKFAEENPDSLGLEVITSKDDEGNGFNPVYYGPSIGVFEDGDFYAEEQLEDWDYNKEDINAVCVN